MRKILSLRSKTFIEDLDGLSKEDKDLWLTNVPDIQLPFDCFLHIVKSYGKHLTNDEVSLIECANCIMQGFVHYNAILIKEEEDKS